jgi:hypothetical protein
MWQQGQVFELKARGVDGQPLWAYWYRLEGRGSARPQVGGFAARGDALKALEKVLARLGPGVWVPRIRIVPCSPSRPTIRCRAS